MAIRKCKIKQWALRLNDGRFSSPETLVWEVATRSELSRLKGTCFVAAYIDCSKCYELVKHSVAAKSAVKTGCNNTVVKLAFGMHKKDRLIQVDVKEEGKELRYFVDDMVLFKETSNENDTVKGIIEDLDRTEARLRAIGQILNDAKEQIFVPFEAVAKLFRTINPDYKGKIGQA
eukprot:5649267-Heterocapsa_arctica.AAC.1